MKRFVLASVCVFALVGVVLAEEFNVTITGLETKDGKTTVSYLKKGKKGEDPTKGSAVLAEKAKVVKGMFNKDDKKFVAGDAIEGGIKSDTFKDVSADKGVGARITIADDGADKGKITQIMVTGKGGKKAGGQ